MWIKNSHLTIIGQGWAKYRDLSLESSSVICRSLRLKQIIDQRDTDRQTMIFCNKNSINVLLFDHEFVLVVFTLGGDLSLFLRERGCNRPFYSCLWPGLWMATMLEVTMFCYRPHCWCWVNKVVFMLTSCIYMTRSPPALPVFIGQVAKHTDCKMAYYARSEYYLQQNTFTRYCAWVDHYLSTIICRSHGRMLINEKGDANAWSDTHSHF